MATNTYQSDQQHRPQKRGLTPRKKVILACGLTLLGLLTLTPTLLKYSTNTSQANLTTYPNSSYPFYRMEDYQVCGDPEKDNNNNGAPNHLELSVDSNANGVANCNDTVYTEEFLKQITNK